MHVRFDQPIADAPVGAESMLPRIEFVVVVSGLHEVQPGRVRVEPVVHEVGVELIVGAIAVSQVEIIVKVDPGHAFDPVQPRTDFHI